MEITKQSLNPGETTLILSGQLDFMVRKDFQAALQNAQAKGTQHVILDLTQVSFVDCAALGILVRAKQKLVKAQITLSILTSPGRVFDILQIMNLDKILSVIPINQET